MGEKGEGEGEGGHQVRAGESLWTSVRGLMVVSWRKYSQLHVGLEWEPGMGNSRRVPYRPSRTPPPPLPSTHSTPTPYLHSLHNPPTLSPHPHGTFFRPLLFSLILSSPSTLSLSLFPSLFFSLSNRPSSPHRHLSPSLSLYRHHGSCFQKGEDGGPTIPTHYIFINHSFEQYWGKMPSFYDFMPRRFIPFLHKILMRDSNCL